MRFHKYQALGNDYLVVDETEGGALSVEQVRRVCDRHYGLGSDGILLGGTAPRDGAYALRILNPDGSEAEKSGNGLRIYARYLWDERAVRGETFPVLTKGGPVRCQARDGGS